MSAKSPLVVAAQSSCLAYHLQILCPDCRDYAVVVLTVLPVSDKTTAPVSCLAQSQMKVRYCSSVHRGSIVTDNTSCGIRRIHDGNYETLAFEFSK